MSWRAFSSKLKVSWRSHPLCPRQPKSVTSDLWRQVWPLHRRLFGKPELAAGGNCSGLDKLQLARPEAAHPWCAAGHGRSVFAAACLAVSRYLATAGPFDGTLLHGTRAKGYSAHSVKPDVCRCAEIEKKHISSTTVSTSVVAREKSQDSGWKRFVCCSDCVRSFSLVPNEKLQVLRGSECSKGEGRAPRCVILARESENARDMQSHGGSVRERHEMCSSFVSTKVLKRVRTTRDVERIWSWSQTESSNCQSRLFWAMFGRQVCSHGSRSWNGSRT